MSVRERSEPRSRPGLRLSLPVVLAAALSACDEPERSPPKPVAPDLLAIAESFEAPTGTLARDDVARALSLVLDVGARLERVDFGAQLHLVMQGVRESSGDDTSHTESTSAHPGLSPQRGPDLGAQAFGVSGEGWLKVTRLCNGWEAQPRPDPANGSMNLQVGFTEAGLDPVIWGEVRRCRYLVPVGDTRHRVELEGGGDGEALRVYLGGPVAFDRLGDVVLLASLRVRVAVDADSFDLDADFRVAPTSGVVDFLVPLSGGPIVATRVDSDTYSLRASNGAVTCVLSQRVCSLSDGSKAPF